MPLYTQASVGQSLGDFDQQAPARAASECCCWPVGTFEEMLDSTLFCRKSTLVHISD